MGKKSTVGALYNMATTNADCIRMYGRGYQGSRRLTARSLNRISPKTTSRIQASLGIGALSWLHPSARAKTAM